jgi:serine/threonine-protein kinase
MGEVWRGTDEVLGRSVAVKVLRAELAEDEAFRKRFRAEARTAGGLPHSGIAAVFDYGETSVGPDGVSPSSTPVQGDGIAFLVMELVPGEPLSAILSRDGALGTERTLALVAQAARALHAAHARGVIHRDVKPANLMVTPEGRIKVTDFGIARPIDHEPLTMTGQVMGTAHYLAPELARGLDASPLSDVYALGVVAYECLAGHRPFEGDNQVLVATAHLSQEPPPLPGTIAPEVIRVVGAAMEKDPARRVRSAEAFALALEKLLAHDPSALDDIGGADDGPLHGAQAPSFGPDGGVAGWYGGSGRHSAGATADPGADVAATIHLSSQPGQPVPQRPQWASTDTAPQGVAFGGAGDDGDSIARGRSLLGPGSSRRRGTRKGISPAVMLMLALLGVVVVLVIVINVTGTGRNLVDLGGDPTPTPSQGAASPTPGGPSVTGTGTPSGSRTRSTKPSRSPSPSTSARPTGGPSSPPPSSPPPTSPPPSSPPPSNPPPSSPPPTSPPPVSVPPSVIVSIGPSGGALAAGRGG